MQQRELYSTLRTAYSGYFDDISPPSAVAKPLLGAEKKEEKEQQQQQQPDAAPDVLPPSRVEKKFYYGEGDDDCEEDVVYIRLTQLQFALLCMGAGVAVGLIISHRMRV